MDAPMMTFNFSPVAIHWYFWPTGRGIPHIE